MAGDWIKMRTGLFTHPKVVRIASALKADTLRTVGGLMSVWCLFDAHSEDGHLDGYTPEVLDAHLRWDGFSDAMIAVGWLEVTPDAGLNLPRFDAHNGNSSKRRAQDADRKREVRKTSAPEADKKRTREEKRREEKRSIPLLTERVANPMNRVLPTTAPISRSLPCITKPCPLVGRSVSGRRPEPQRCAPAGVRTRSARTSNGGGASSTSARSPSS